MVHQENWRRVYPKADTVIFLAIVPEGGDSTFGLIAGLAVAAFAIAVSGGALATLAPAIFGTVAGVAGLSGRFGNRDRRPDRRAGSWRGRRGRSVRFLEDPTTRRRRWV